MPNSFKLISQNASRKEKIIVTHCDINYASKALSLITSLKKNGYSGLIILFCHDWNSYGKFIELNLNQVEIHHISTLERFYPQLEYAKSKRSKVEYFYCVTPYLIKFITENFVNDSYVYLDSDIFFYSNFDEMLPGSEKYAVAITPHRFAQRNKTLEKYGKYNVGLVSFNNSEDSNRILNWWAEQCLISTSANFKDGVYGDQKYLDKFSDLTNNVKVILQAGQNAAPWNCSHAIQIDKDIYIVSDSSRNKLYYFHFSGLKRYKYFSLLGFMPFRSRPSATLKKLVYIPYLESLKKSEELLKVKKHSNRDRVKFFDLINYLRYKDFIIKI